MPSANHLGHELHESEKIEYDASIKRAIFIDRSVQMREMFKFASHVEVLAAMRVFCCSFLMAACFGTWVAQQQGRFMLHGLQQ